MQPRERLFLEVGGGGFPMQRTAAHATAFSERHHRARSAATQHVSRWGIGVRDHGEEEPFSLWFCPVRKLMLSAGLLITPRFSWSASLVKLGFFAFVQFRQLRPQ
jgi:hypothetical protein